MLVSELIAKLLECDQNKRILFDTEAARFNQHLIDVDSVVEETTGLYEDLKDEPVVLHSKAARDY